VICNYAYHRDSTKRKAFSKLSRSDFGLDFKSLLADWWWDDSCICDMFFYGEKAVFNVSVTKMRFRIFGREFETHQLGMVVARELFVSVAGFLKMGLFIPFGISTERFLWR